MKRDAAQRQAEEMSGTLRLCGYLLPQDWAVTPLRVELAKALRKAERRGAARERRKKGGR